MTGSQLRPNVDVLGEEWLEIVQGEYEQVERLREWHDDDYYRPVASHFADNPHRTDDDILNRMLAISSADTTWLDVGAGGGRYSLPLALANRQVTAVDPSRSMLDVLESEACKHEITNIEVIEAAWPDPADSLAADYGLMAHVGYDIRPINPFLDGFEQACTERCIALMMDRAPSGGFVRLWEQVHGEPRLVLPAMREFLHLLLARGATPEVETFYFPRRPRDEEEIRNSARRRLWLTEGSEKDQLLQEILTRELADGVDDYQLPRLIAMISWAPADR